MIKIVRLGARHAEALHDPARAPIGADRQSHDLRQAELVKPVVERSPSGLASVLELAKDSQMV